MERFLCIRTVFFTMGPSLEYFALAEVKREAAAQRFLAQNGRKNCVFFLRSDRAYVLKRIAF